MKRPCVFLVADGTMAQVLNKFLSRGYLKIGWDAGLSTLIFGKMSW